MRDKARGCIIGQLTGDALGSQVEFLSSARIKHAFPNGVREITASLTWDTLPGQITDDSEMALALARTLLISKRYDQHAVRAAYLAWIRSGPFDCGNTVLSTLGGKPNPDSQANGALMRVSPLGIWGVKQDRKALWQAADEDAMLTHVNPVCRQINQIFVTLIAEAIRSSEDGEALYSDLCRRPENYCGEPILPEIRDCIQKAASEKPVLDGRHSGWVLLAFQNALYQLIHAVSFDRAVIDTVMGGGDTDTNGAICGALMGAVLGYSAIPEDWSSKVLSCEPTRENKAAYPRPEIYWAADALRIADALLELRQRVTADGEAGS